MLSVLTLASCHNIIDCMREQLLDLLICPACEGGSWKLDCRERLDTGVIDSGRLLCAACGTSYTISGGIVDLLPEPDDVIRRERAGWQEFLKDSPEELDEAWLLALPRIDRRVSANAESIAHWSRQAGNVENLIAHLELPAGAAVLEVGAGRCWASACLARRGCQVVALDVVRARNAGGLETGIVYLEHGTPYFDRVLASMERIPFREGTFDLVLSIASIHHTAFLNRVLAEASRVLRRGGKLALTSEPCIRVLKEKRVENVETEVGINEHVYNLIDYRRAFREAGLKPTFYLPGALLDMLEEEGLTMPGGRLKAWVFRLARRIWGVETIRGLLSSQPANVLGLLFLEYGLTAIAEKETEMGA